MIEFLTYILQSADKSAFFSPTSESILAQKLLILACYVLTCNKTLVLFNK